MQKEVKEKPQYAIVASVQLPNVSDVEFEASLTELRELAKTLGFTVIHSFTQKAGPGYADLRFGAQRMSDVEFEASLTELRNLAKALGFRSASCRLMR